MVGYRLDPTPVGGSVLGIEFFGGRELDLIKEFVHGLVVGLPIEQIPISEGAKTVARTLSHGNRVSAHRRSSPRLFILPDGSGCVMAVTLWATNRGHNYYSSLWERLTNINVSLDPTFPASIPELRAPVRPTQPCARRKIAKCAFLKQTLRHTSNARCVMTSTKTHSDLDMYRSRLRRLRRALDFETVFITAFLSLVVFVGPAAAQASGPTGGSGGAVTGWETILTNLYDVVYTTLQYAGLTVLVIGLIVWLTARQNSQRSETGMKLTMGGGAMVVAYFGLGAIVSLLEFIAG